MTDEFIMNGQDFEPTVSSPTYTALLCCPFCGSSNIEEDWGAVTQGSIDYQCGDITCADCEAKVTIELRGEEVDWHGDKSGSVRLKAKWNKRAS
tara:strand:- start:629 stop:910 length:282 start_codon:yes stop_codon:yes gene_type:complete